MSINQAHINLLQVIGTDTVLKKVANTAGGEWHGSCPFCGGEDRFSVQPFRTPQGRWYCRKCTDRGGDALAYVMRRDNLSFKAAMRLLGLQQENTKKQSKKKKPDKKTTSVHQAPAPSVEAALAVSSLKQDYTALNDAAWQKAASDFYQCCRDNLQSALGQRGMDYLLGRGLTSEDITRYGLGYNPTVCRANWGAVKVWLPAGIVIPWILDGKYWNLRIRRLEENASPKYISPKGVANGLFCPSVLQSSSEQNIQPVAPGDIVIMVEGEFDALVAQSKAQSVFGARVKAVATGSAMGARVFEWVCRINRAERILLAFDDDLDGDKATIWWQEQLGKGKAVRLRPTHHDITDMALAGEDFVAWLSSAGLNPVILTNAPQAAAKSE